MLNLTVHIVTIRLLKLTEQICRIFYYVGALGSSLEVKNGSVYSERLRTAVVVSSVWSIVNNILDGSGCGRI